MATHSVAVEFVSCPSVLLLDEPTTGLDFASAFGLVQQLSSLCMQSRHTMVCVIHQPSSQIWDLFHKVMFINRGEVVFCGGVEHLLPYLESQHLIVPQYYHVAEFVLDVLSDEFNPAALSPKAFKSSSLFIVAGTDEEAALSLSSPPEEELKPSLTRIQLVSILLLRNLTLLWRNPQLLAFRVLAIVVLSLITALTFYQQGVWTTDLSLRARTGVFFFTTGFFTFMSLSVLPFFLTQRTVSKREMASGLYTPVEFFVAYALPLLFTTACVASASAAIVFFMVSLRNFGPYLYVNWMYFVLVECVMLAFGAVAPNYILAMLASTMFVSSGMVTMGFFRVFNQISWVVRWLGYILPHRYYFRALMRNEFETMGNTTSVVAPTGVAYLEDFGIDVSEVTFGGEVGICAGVFGLCPCWFLLLAHNVEGVIILFFYKDENTNSRSSAREKRGKKARGEDSVISLQLRARGGKRGLGMPHPHGGLYTVLLSMPCAPPPPKQRDSARQGASSARRALHVRYQRLESEEERERTFWDTFPCPPVLWQKTPRSPPA